MSILKNKAQAQTNAAASDDAGPSFEQVDETLQQENPNPDASTAAEPAAEPNLKSRSAKADAKAEDKPVEPAKQDAQADAAPADEPAAKVEAAAKPTSAGVSLIKVDANGNPITFLNSGGGDKRNYLEDLRGAFEKVGIDVDYDTFPRLRVDAGIIATADGKEAGTWIELQIISFSPTWTVTPGVDGEEGKKNVRFSKDGKTIRGSGDDDEYADLTLEEYKDVLKEKGFEKAAIKEYMGVYGLVRDAEQADFPRDEVVALNLAPQARKKFEGYILTRNIAARMGKIKETHPNPVVHFKTERAKGGDNKSYHNIIPGHGNSEPVDL